MTRSFLKGLWLGLIGSIALLGGLMYWIYRYTRKVPFPVHRPVAGELTFRLVAPAEVPALWATWREELTPVFEALCTMYAQVQGRLVEFLRKHG